MAPLSTAGCREGTRAAPSRAPSAGIGLKPQHYRQLAEDRPQVGVLEVHAENYMGRGGPPHYWLDRLRQDYPLSFHGVGLSLGSADGIEPAHLARLAEAVARFEPALVSEHLAWSGFGGLYLNDLLPLPYSEEALETMVRNVATVQDALGRTILIENPSRYDDFAPSDMDEADFLNALAARTGCGILLDVNNVMVSSANLGFDAECYLRRIDASRVGEIHLAGHRRSSLVGDPVLIDDHGGPVADPVWRLYRLALERSGSVPTVVEWDTDVPALPTLVAEAERADHHGRAALCRRTPDVLAG